MITLAWQDRLFIWESAALLFAIGLAWINGWPKYRSVWGLQLRISMVSEENWRKLHRRVGWLAIGQAVWLALPFPNATVAALVQIPAALFGTIIIVVMIKRELEKESAGKS
ncbi:MAG: hypothetical protein AAB229_05780 [Candidatus Hydrogenedentota bacterium]